MFDQILSYVQNILFRRGWFPEHHRDRLVLHYIIKHNNVNKFRTQNGMCPLSTSDVRFGPKMGQIWDCFRMKSDLKTSPGFDLFVVNLADIWPISDQPAKQTVLNEIPHCVLEWDVTTSWILSMQVEIFY